MRVGGIAVNTLFLLAPGSRPLPLHEGIYGLAVNVLLLVGLTILRGTRRHEYPGTESGPPKS